MELRTSSFSPGISKEVLISFGRMVSQIPENQLSDTQILCLLLFVAHTFDDDTFRTYKAAKLIESVSGQSIEQVFNQVICVLPDAVILRCKTLLPEICTYLEEVNLKPNPEFSFGFQSPFGYINSNTTGVIMYCVALAYVICKYESDFSELDCCNLLLHLCNTDSTCSSSVYSTYKRNISRVDKTVELYCNCESLYRKYFTPLLMQLRCAK